MCCNEQGACTCLACSRQLHAGVSPLVTGEKQKREKTMTFQEQKRVHMEWRVILVSYPAPLSSDHAFRRTHWFECRGICIGYLCMDRLFLLLRHSYLVTRVRFKRIDQGKGNWGYNVQIERCRRVKKCHWRRQGIWGDRQDPGLRRQSQSR